MKVTLDEEKHRYLTDKGMPLMSVSEMLRMLGSVNDHLDDE